MSFKYKREESIIFVTAVNKKQKLSLAKNEIYLKQRNMYFKMLKYALDIRKHAKICTYEYLKNDQ